MELIILGVIFGSIGLWIWSVVDILGRSAYEWKAIGHDKTLWLVLILFVGLPGSIAYLAGMRPKLERLKALGGMPPQVMLNAAAPGWYPDPGGAPMLRWFDGRQWTPQTAPMGPAAGGMPPQPGGPPPSYPQG